MTPLEPLLRRAIEAQGPLDVATFMAVCLGHRRHGYYRVRDPLGAAGDFVTAPEISQLFGELTGAALAQAWLDLGRPERVHLVEAGPGRGTLMADLWRATLTVPGLHAAARVHLVETSPHLRALQAEKLSPLGATWHDDLASLPAEAPLLLVANEFLDALPIHQLVRTGPGWRERRVGLDAAGRLAFTLAGPILPAAVVPTAPDADVVEPAPAREAWMGALAARLVRQGGLALIVDYGARALAGDTLQAVRAHRQVDPLATPGEADLSSHVDFGGLLRAAREQGARCFGPVAQGTWLRRLGIEARLDRLTVGASADRVQALHAGAARLVDATAMGTLFQVLAVSGTDGPLPAGFDPQEESGR